MLFKIRHVLTTTIFVVVCSIFVSYAFYAFAGTGENVRGFAWGGTQSVDGAYNGMGWISMNSLSDGSASSYGVNIPLVDGALSGYAWSEYYGWISFNGGDLAGCNPGLAQATRSGNSITGGARILAIKDAVATGNAGGYDGCISLSGGGYGLTISGSASPLSVNGYAWSSDLGWIDFTGVQIEYVNPTLGSINAPDCKISNGASTCNTTVTWVINNPITPIIKNGSTQIASTGSGSIGQTLTYGGYYKMSAHDLNLQSGTVVELGYDEPQAVCTDTPVQTWWNGSVCSATPACSDAPNDNDGDGFTDMADFGCLSPTDTSEVDPTSVDLTASPRIVPQGQQTTLEWNTHGGDEAQCTLTAQGNATNLINTNTLGLDTGTVSVTVNAGTTYTLTCPGNKTDFVNVELVPIGFET